MYKLHLTVPDSVLMFLRNRNFQVNRETLIGMRPRFEQFLFWAMVFLSSLFMIKMSGPLGVILAGGLAAYFFMPTVEPNFNFGALLPYALVGFSVTLLISTGLFGTLLAAGLLAYFIYLFPKQPLVNKPTDAAAEQRLLARPDQAA